MNFKEAYADDLDEAFFDEDEFAEKHLIDGVEMLAIKQEINFKDAGNVLKGSFNPRENTQNDAGFLLFIKTKDAKRRFTANSRIQIDNKDMFIRSVEKTPGLIRLTIGRKLG